MGLPIMTTWTAGGEFFCSRQQNFLMHQMATTHSQIELATIAMIANRETGSIVGH